MRPEETAMTPGSSQNTPEEKNRSLNTTVEPDGPDEGAFTYHSEVFIRSEEDFSG